MYLSRIILTSIVLGQSSQAAWAMSQAPAQESSVLGSLFLGLFWLGLLLVPLVMVLGTNWLFQAFLVKVCDAKASVPAASLPTLLSDAARPEKTPLGHAPPVQRSSFRIGLGAALGLLSMFVLAITGAESTRELQGWHYLFYWAVVFGPYYIIGYWNEPLRGGSSRRIVLLLISGAVALGWMLHLGLWW